MSEGRRTVTQAFSPSGALISEEHQVYSEETEEVWHLHDAPDGTAAIREWNEDGVLLREVHCRYGRHHGRLRAWDDEGTLIRYEFWENGKLVEKKL